jgi:hypothetical protein
MILHGKELPSIKKNHNMATIMIQLSHVSYAHIHYVFFSRTMVRNLLQMSFSNNNKKNAQTKP